MLRRAVRKGVAALTAAVGLRAMVALPAHAQTKPLPPLPAPASAAGASASMPIAAPAAAAPAAQTPAWPDVVTLKDGSLFRGTIVEIVAGDHVDVLLTTGATRRFPVGDVAYAGPAGAAPSPEAAPASMPGFSAAPAAPPRAVKPGDVAVHVASDQTEVQLLMRTGHGTFKGAGYVSSGDLVVLGGRSKQYSAVCVAPCDSELPSGKLHLALSHRGGKAIDVDEPVDLRGPAATLEADYTSHTALRALGWVVLGTGMVAGTVIIATGIHGSPSCGSRGCSEGTQIDGGSLVGGILVMALGATVGTIMATTWDKAGVTVMPAVAPSPLPAAGPERAATPAGGVQGLSVGVSF